MSSALKSQKDSARRSPGATDKSDAAAAAGDPPVLLRLRDISRPGGQPATSPPDSAPEDAALKLHQAPENPAPVAGRTLPEAERQVSPQELAQRRQLREAPQEGWSRKSQIKAALLAVAVLGVAYVLMGGGGREPAPTGPSDDAWAPPEIELGTQRGDSSPAAADQGKEESHTGHNHEHASSAGRDDAHAPILDDANAPILDDEHAAKADDRGESQPEDSSPERTDEGDEIDLELPSDSPAPDITQSTEAAVYNYPHTNPRNYVYPEGYLPQDPSEIRVGMRPDAPARGVQGDGRHQAPVGRLKGTIEQPSLSSGYERTR